MVVGQDGTMRFYDIATRTQLGDPISVDPGRIPSVALRDDGMAAAAVAGGGIVFWNLDPTNWEAAACRLAGRNLTRAEWTSTSATSRPTPPPARTIQPKPDNPTKTARPLRLCQTQAAPTTSTTASLNHNLS
jgi:hypothetical protein